MKMVDRLTNHNNQLYYITNTSLSAIHLYDIEDVISPPLGLNDDDDILPRLSTDEHSLRL
jgi:hypothetical protein